MLALTESAIRRSMVNCSRSEAAALTPPRDLAELDWDALEVLGWRDPRAELRGYLLHEQADGVVGLALRAARHLDEVLQAVAVAERIEGLRRRLRAFTGDVLRG